MNTTETKPLATPFTDNPCPIEQIQNSRIYRLKEKLESGEKLTREDKDYIFSQTCNNNFVGKRAVPLGGWKIDFSTIMKMFFVEFDHGHIQKYYAPDKMAIRNNPYMNEIRRIVEVV